MRISTLVTALLLACGGSAMTAAQPAVDAKLAAVKAKYDPRQCLSPQQNIRPGRAGNDRPAGG